MFTTSIMIGNNVSFTLLNSSIISWKNPCNKVGIILNIIMNVLISHEVNIYLCGMMIVILEMIIG